MTILCVIGAPLFQTIGELISLGLCQHEIADREFADIAILESAFKNLPARFQSSLR